MLSSEEIEDEVVWTEYTDRHKRRLAYKRSLKEFKKILQKIAENRNYGISDDDSEMNFSCNSDINTENIVALQDRGNIINIQVPVEDHDSVNEEIFNTSEELEMPSDNEDNVSINNKACERKKYKITVKSRSNCTKILPQTFLLKSFIIIIVTIKNKIILLFYFQLVICLYSNHELKFFFLYRIHRMRSMDKIWKILELQEILHVNLWKMTLSPKLNSGLQIIKFVSMH